MRYIPLSTEWFAALHGVMSSKANSSSLAGINFSVCEVITDVPKGTSNQSKGCVAWHWRVNNGQLLFEIGEAEDVDVKIQHHYSTFSALCRMAVSDGPETSEKMDRIRGHAMENGTSRVIGSPPEAGQLQVIEEVFGEVHDVMASLTL